MLIRYTASKVLVFYLTQLEHMFKHRLNSSYKYAVEYLKQFPSPIINTIAKLVSYIAGAFAAVIILISLIDESLLEGHVSILVPNYTRNLSLCIESTCIFLIYKYSNP